MNLAAAIELTAYGTSEGACKAVRTKGHQAKKECGTTNDSSANPDLENYRLSVLKEFGRRQKEILSTLRDMDPRILSVKLGGSVIDPRRFTEDSDIDLKVGVPGNLDAAEIEFLTERVRGKVQLGGGFADAHPEKVRGGRKRLSGASDVGIASMPDHGHPEQMLSKRTVRQRRKITDSTLTASSLFRVVDYRNRLVLHRGLTRKEADRVAQSKAYLKVEPDTGGKRNPPTSVATKGRKSSPAVTRRTVWFPDSAA